MTVLFQKSFVLLQLLNLFSVEENLRIHHKFMPKQQILLLIPYPSWYSHMRFAQNFCKDAQFLIFLLPFPIRKGSKSSDDIRRLLPHSAIPKWK